MRTQKNYDIEKSFRMLCKTIDDKVKENGYNSIDKALWDKLSNEVSKIQEKYESEKNYLDLYHIYHNYHSRLVWRMLAERKAHEAVTEFGRSCIFLLKRYNLKPYSHKTLENMSKSFMIKSRDISNYMRELKIYNIEDCIKTIELLLSIIKSLWKEVSNTKEESSPVMFLQEWWTQIIRSIQITTINFTNNVNIGDECTTKSILKLLDNFEELNRAIETSFTPEKFYYLVYLNYAIMYRLTKKLIYFYLRFLYFSKSIDDANNKISELISRLPSYSQKCCAYFNRFYKLIPDDRKVNFERERLGYEIDKEFSEYLSVLHKERNALKAFKKLDSLYKRILTKVFIEGVQLNDYQLKYFAEELAFLSVFIRLLLIKDDLNRTKNRYFEENDWRYHLLKNICSSLEKDVLSLFKYKMTIQQEVELKIVTRAFTGGFSVYFVAELIKMIVNEQLLEKSKLPKSEKYWTKFIECLRMVKDPKDIKVNFKFDPTDSKTPDIDVMVGNTPIFIKNGYLNYNDISSIRKEISYAEKNDLRPIFVIINFYRNMSLINKILELKKDLESRDGEVYVMDLKDVVERLIDILQKERKWTYQLRAIDILKTLDY